jgi:hypothetical protein
MKKLKMLKRLLGIGWFAVSIAVFLMIFSNLEHWDNIFANSGVKINNWLTGGGIASRIERKAYQIDIHKPVFDNAFGGETKNGFVQLDIHHEGKLNADVHEDVDYDGDGKLDFTIDIDRKTLKACLKKYNDNVGWIMDKTSMAEFVYRGYSDSRNGVLTDDSGLYIRILIKKNKKLCPPSACMGCGLCFKV